LARRSATGNRQARNGPNHDNLMMMSQLDLFPEAAAPPVSTIPSIESVRARIEKIMAALRQPGGPGWTVKEGALWRVVLPQMTNWLPPAERDATRAEFERLIGPA
jgi:hypothetical protein